MTKEEVEKVVTHTGDVYHIKVKGEPEVRNFYVSRIGPWYIEQNAGGGSRRGHREFRVARKRRGVLREGAR